MIIFATSPLVAEWVAGVKEPGPVSAPPQEEGELFEEGVVLGERLAGVKRVPLPVEQPAVETEQPH